MKATHTTTSSIFIPSPSHLSPMHSSQSSFTSSEADLLGGKTIHHQASPVKTFLNRDTVKVSTISSPILINSIESSSMPPLKKIKLGLGRSGKWETKPSSILSTETSPIKKINEKEEEDVPVDLKSRCVIQLEEMSAEVINNFKATVSEIYFLSDPLNDYIDLHSWLKKPNTLLEEYITKMAGRHDLVIKDVLNEEAKGFTTLTGTLPTITPVVISKTLPLAVSAYKQQLTFAASNMAQSVPEKLNLPYKNSTNLVPGGIPLSTTTATTTVDSPAIFNVDTTPATINNDSASSLLPNKQEAAVELAKQEAKVMRRIVELRRRGLWSHKRLPKVLEPNRQKSHWDHLLSEVQWMATDFAEERRWKLSASFKMSRAVQRGIEKRNAIDNNNGEDNNNMKVARSVACIIKQYWHNAFKTSLHVDDMGEEEMLGGVSGDGSKLIGGGCGNEEEDNYDDDVAKDVSGDDDVIKFDDSPLHVLKEIYGEEDGIMGEVYVGGGGWPDHADDKKKQEEYKYDSIGQLMQAAKQLQESIDQSEKTITDQSEEVTSIRSKFKRFEHFITAESFKVLQHLDQCQQHNLPSILAFKAPLLYKPLHLSLCYLEAVLVGIHLAHRCTEGRHLVVCGEGKVAMWRWVISQLSMAVEVLDGGPCCPNAEHLMKTHTNIITTSFPNNDVTWHTIVLCRQQTGNTLPPHKHLVCLSRDAYDVTKLVAGGLDDDSRLQLEQVVSKEVSSNIQPITKVSTKHVTCHLSANQEERYKAILKEAKNSKKAQLQMYASKLMRVSSCFSWHHHQHQVIHALSEAFNASIDESKPNTLNFLLLLLSRLEDGVDKQNDDDVKQNMDDVKQKDDVDDSFKRVLNILKDNDDKFSDDVDDDENDNEKMDIDDKNGADIKDEHNDKKDDDKQVNNTENKDDINVKKEEIKKSNQGDNNNDDGGDKQDDNEGRKLVKSLLTEDLKKDLKSIMSKVAQVLKPCLSSFCESMNNKNKNENKKNNNDKDDNSNNKENNDNKNDDKVDNDNGEDDDKPKGLRVIKYALKVMRESKTNEDGIISALRFLIKNSNQSADDANYSNKWIVINDNPSLLAPQLQGICGCHVIKPAYHTCKRKKVIDAFNDSSKVGGVTKDDVMMTSCLLLTKESMLEVLREGMLVVAGNIVVLQDVAEKKEKREKKGGMKQEVGGRDKGVGVVTQLLKQMTAVCLAECCVYSLTYAGTLEHRMLMERMAAGDYDVLTSSHNSFHHFIHGQLQQSTKQHDPHTDLEVFYTAWRNVVEAVKKKKIDTYVKRVLTRGDMELMMNRKRKYDYEEDDDEDPCNILTYRVDHENPQTFVSDLTGELMPVWAPPTPPQEDDFYLDECLLHHYDVSAMPESQLPPVYVRRKKKKSHRVDGRMLNKAPHHGNLKLHTTSLQRPRSLFEKSSVPPATTFINVFSNPNAMTMGYHYDRDGRLVNKLGLPLGRPAPKSPTLQTYTKPPPCEPEHSSDWLVHEDWAVLQAYQMHHESPTPSMLYQQTPMRHPNWHLVADVVNTFSRTYRSARQCRTRFERTILVRESGKNVNDVNALRNKIKRSNKGIYKSKNSKPMKTVQLYAQDNNRAITSQFNLKFDLIKALAEKRKMESRSSVPSLSCKMDKQQQLTLMSDHNINYDSPFTSCQVINARIDRLSREQREKRNADKPSQPQTQQQQQPQVQQASNNTTDNNNTHQQQQQQATPSKILPISLANMFSNSQLRMVQQSQHNNTPSQLVIQPSLQQQQQVILQAAGQSQLLVTASSVYDNRTQQPQQQISIGKVPLVSSIGSSGNLKSLSFVVNPSTSGQQSAAYVAKTNPVNSAVALVPTSASNFKGIRATTCNTKLLANTTNINIPNLMNQVSGNKVSFRGSPSIQLNQRLKPTTIQQQLIQQQQLVNNSSGNMAKLNNIITLATTPLNSSQSFHVKNAQVVLKQRSATPVQQTGNNTNRIASISTNNQAFQLTHLQLPSKSNLIEQLQQQQSLPSNISALIRANPTTSSIQIAGKNFFNGKMISQPANVSIWHQQQQRQPVKKTTIATINLQNKPNRTAIVGLNKNTSITPSVIYHSSQKLFVQSKQVPQTQNTSTVLPRTLPTTSANDGNSGA